MKRKLILFTALIALTTIGCEKGLIENPETLKETTFEGITELGVSVINDETDNTKAVITGNANTWGTALEVNWETNDMISLFDENGVNVATFKYTGTNSKVASFMLESGKGLSYSKTYTAVYPATDHKYLSDRNKRLISDMETINEVSTFEHIHSALRMSGTFTTPASGGTPLSSVEMGKETSIMTIKFSLSGDYAPKELKFFAGSNGYTVDLTGTTFNEMTGTYTVNFMIAAEPNTYEKHIKINVKNTNNDIFTFTGESKIIISGGRRYNLDINTSDFVVDNTVYTSISDEAGLHAIENGTSQSNFKRYILTSDITVTSEWATKNVQYIVLDGNGHTITVTQPAGSASYGGIFNASYGQVTIRDLNLALDIQAKDAGATAGTKLGGVFNNVGSGVLTFVNCSVSGTITAPTIPVGGFVGETTSTSSARFINCHSTLNITGGSEVGGLLGDATKGDAYAYNCSNRGNILASYAVGGLVGVGLEEGINCENFGNIEMNYSPGASITQFGVGGICGTNGSTDGLLSECVNHGTISGINPGGIVGAYRGTVRNCTNESTAIINYSVDSHLTSGAGGIVGYLHAGSAENCVNKGTIKGSKSPTSGTYPNPSSTTCYIGGIVGNATYLSGVISAVMACVNEGTINVSGYDISAGGIVGRNSMDIVGCYSFGDIFIDGRAQPTGGIVATISSTGSVTGCYFAGRIASITGEETDIQNSGTLYSKKDAEAMITGCNWLEYPADAVYTVVANLSTPDETAGSDTTPAVTADALNSNPVLSIMNAAIVTKSAEADKGKYANWQYAIGVSSPEIK